MMNIALQQRQVLGQNVGKDLRAARATRAKAMISLARPERLELPTTWFEVIPSSPRPHQINRLARHHRAGSAEPCGSALSNGGQNSGKEFRCE